MSSRRRPGSRGGEGPKKPPSKRFQCPDIGDDHCLVSRYDSLLSSVRKVAGLSCPQYRGAENACQARKDACASTGQGGRFVLVYRSKILLTGGTLVKNE